MKTIKFYLVYSSLSIFVLNCQQYKLLEVTDIQPEVVLACTQSMEEKENRLADSFSKQLTIQEGNCGCSNLLEPEIRQAIGRQDKAYLKNLQEKLGKEQLAFMLKDAIISYACNCIEAKQYASFKSVSKFFLEVVEEGFLTIKTLSSIRSELDKLCWKNKNKKGVGPVKSFNEHLKQYTPRKRDYHPDSEGESENEDPAIVYRSLSKDDFTSLKDDRLSGIFSKGDNPFVSIIKHISPRKGQEKDRDQSPWISATRSIKVAAAWSSEADCNLIAKIKLDEVWSSQLCNHQEKGSKKVYDCTNEADRVAIFGAGKKNLDCTAALSSQEVLIFREIPREYIVAFYATDKISEQEYCHLKGLPLTVLRQLGIDRIVKTRKKVKDKATPTPRVIRNYIPLGD